MALSDGDRLHLRTYEIEIKVLNQALAKPVPAVPADPFDVELPSVKPASRPDQLLHRRTGGNPFASTVSGPVSLLPDDYDPLAPDPEIDSDLTAPLPRVELPADWDAEDDPQTMAGGVKANIGVLMRPSGAKPARSLHSASAASDDLLATFLHGAKIEGMRPPDPTATMEMLGAAFREVVSGLRQVKTAHESIKAEFHIEEADIRGNDPLKFSTDDAAALAALLGNGRRSDMGAADAMSDALADIRFHEAAAIAVMRSAVRALLAELDPARLRDVIGEGGFNVLSSQRKVRAWDAYEANFAKLSQAVNDEFAGAFGKDFARGYEAALSEAEAKERSR
jgi:type VI secretion system FHA domain protein